MKPKWLFVGLATVALAASQIALSADWKTKAAQKAIGNAAQAGLENAVEDAAKDVAFDAALGAVKPDRPEIDRDRGQNIDRDRIEDVGRDDVGDALGSAASGGIETAMDVAKFAQGIDNAIDVADTVKKANKVRKVIK